MESSLLLSILNGFSILKIRLPNYSDQISISGKFTVFFATHSKSESIRWIIRVNLFSGANGNYIILAQFDF